MADDMHVIADLLADGLDLSGAEINDILDSAPFIAQLPFTPSSDGTIHKYIRETANPVVGFRDPNVGRDFDSSVDTLQTDTLEILDWSFAADKAVGDAWKRGAENYIAREGRRHIRAALSKLEAQVLNSVGVGGDAAGFVGFQTLTTLDALADAMVIDGGGAGVTLQTSVYLVHQSEMNGVVGVSKGDGMPVSMGETIVQDLVDAGGAHFPAYYTPACSWFGLQVGGAFSISRIANIEPGTAGLTDDLIAEAIAAHPTGQKPNVIVANRAAVESLRASRTATNATGAPAPIPEEAFGIMIVETDGLTQIEAVVA
jgi:hypothetical protein